MCYFPRLITNRKYSKTKKNGGIIPAVFDERVLQVPVGCGQCMECRKKKAREWQIRLLEEVKTAKNGIFVTLTFSNESIAELAKDKECIDYEGYELDNAIATRATRLFLERWRKEYKKSLRHWFITELGHNGTENIHIHGIVWTEQGIKAIAKHWKYGYIWPKDESTTNFVSEKTVNYITKYVYKRDKDHEYYKSKILTSAGIGSKYTERDLHKHKYKEDNETVEAITTRTGHKISIPIYWRNKIWTDEEKEKLWIQKLNSNIRYVGAYKIDISKGEQEYYQALQEAQRKNKELGYGNGDIDWTKKKYEQERRKLKQQERVSKAKKLR